MGLLGTDISVNFAQRIFSIFSSDGEKMELEEYLKYIDLYHHGNERERCLTTYRLMDEHEDNKVDFKEFENYINLIIGAIKKVHPGAEDDLLTSKEIRMLFNKISDDKEFFTYKEFEKVYFEKPLLLSWIDYFKNNDAKFLIHIDRNIKLLLILLERFNMNMVKIFENFMHINGHTFNFRDPIKEIEKFCKAIEKIRKHFMKVNESFNIRNIFENVAKPEDSIIFPDKGRLSHTKTINFFSNNMKMSNLFRNSEKSISNTNNFVFQERGSGYSTLNKNTIIPNYSKPDFEDKVVFTDSNLNDSNYIKEQFNHLRRKLQDDNYEYNSNSEENDNINIDLIVEEDEKDKSNSKIEHNYPHENFIERSTFRKYNNSKNIILEDEYENEEMLEVQSENGLGTCRIKELTKHMSFRNKSQLSPHVDLQEEEEKSKEVENELSGKIFPDNEFKEFADIITFKRKGTIVEKEDEEINIPNKHRNNFLSKTYIHQKNNPSSGSAIGYRSTAFNSRDNTNAVVTTINSNNNIDLEKYNDEIKKFAAKLMTLFENNQLIINWISSSYKWIEEKYLKSTIKKERKKEVKIEKKVNKPISDKKLKKKNKVKMTKENALKLNDENFALLLNMIMGIQLSVNATSNISLSVDSNLNPYLRSSKYTLPSANFNSAHLDGVFNIATYGAVIFHNIRKINGIDKDIFIQSISPQDFVTEMLISSTTIIEELFSTSKSGSLFYHTRDGKYILKTIAKKEYSCLKSILPNYFKHILTNKFTLLPKFYGCYKLVRKVGKNRYKFYFLVMDNVFSTNREIHLKYDLKGSKIGREVLSKLPENERNLEKYPFALKDLDLDKREGKFHIGVIKFLNYLE